jgi:predicted metalloprotease
LPGGLLIKRTEILAVVGGRDDGNKTRQSRESAMRYDDFRRSDDIEDRRDDGGMMGGGGGGMGLPLGGGGLGIGTIIVLGLISYAFGIDPRILIGGAEVLSGGGSSSTYQSDRSSSNGKTGAPTDEMGSMISGILGEIDDRWSEVFQASGQTYTGPKIVLFRNVTNGGRCGMAQSAMGPFYCPPDRKIFLDTGFFREVETRFHGCSGSACKFTAAYIIAHEAGHHVQNLLGIIPRVTQMQQQVSSKAEANALQVRVELQADCLAGVWVNREEKKRPNFLEPGDIDAALTTASAIGDDTLQRQATGRVVPDSFTHGSAAQRKRWFMTGYQQGTVQACNTFGSDSL